MWVCEKGTERKCLSGVIEKVCVSAIVRACVSVREREKRERRMKINMYLDA